MAMSTPERCTGGRRSARRGAVTRPMSEINMTPFIDVMLVLLIIFMVAAPLLTVGVPLDLPQTKAAALNIDKQPLTLSVKADGKIYLMETAIGMDEMGPEASGHLQDRTGRATHLCARRQGDPITDASRR